MFCHSLVTRKSKLCKESGEDHLTHAHASAQPHAQAAHTQHADIHVRTHRLAQLHEHIHTQACERTRAHTRKRIRTRKRAHSPKRAFARTYSYLHTYPQKRAYTHKRVWEFIDMNKPVHIRSFSRVLLLVNAAESLWGWKVWQNSGKNVNTGFKACHVSCTLKGFKSKNIFCVNHFSTSTLEKKKEIALTL